MQVLRRIVERKRGWIAPRHRGFMCVLYNLCVNLRSEWCLAAVLALSLGTLTWAESVSQLQPTGYVNDFAHVLNQNTTAQINDICRQVDEKAHAQIAVVTINSLDGADIESYAVDLFKKWGIGNKIHRPRRTDSVRHKGSSGPH